MAFPQVVATNTSVEAVNTLSHTVDLPAGIQAGYILLDFFACDAVPTITWPNEGTDWYQLFETANAGNACKLSAAYRIADGGEGASITVTTSAEQQSAHHTYLISSWHGTTAPEDANADGGSTSSPNPPALNPANWGTEDTLWFAVVSYDAPGGNGTISAYPTNYTNGTNTESGTGGGAVGIGTCRRELNAASEDPSTFTLDDVVGTVVATVGVRPAAAVEDQFTTVLIKPASAAP
ncbi:MAG: hypothetical protein ACYTEQ_26645 [Planctomycetota bacterium]|jgi:hypothetical protein